MLKIKKIAQEIEAKFSKYQDLSDLLACVKAVRDLHQTHHWQTRGDSYYGDHQLFERLYEESEDEIDDLAEKVVALSGVEAVNLLDQSKIRHECITEMLGNEPNVSPDEMVSRSLKAEEKVLGKIADILAELEKENLDTPGLSNLLEDIADRHEKFLYLLGQRHNKSD